MHVGNNSSSEARDHVIEQEQCSQMENSPPQCPRGQRLWWGQHQLPGDTSHTRQLSFGAGDCLLSLASRVTHSSCSHGGTHGGLPDQTEDAGARIPASCICDLCDRASLEHC